MGKDRRARGRSALLALPLAALLASGCSRFGAVYPPRPAAIPGPPSSDPAPSRLVVHLSVTREALRSALDGAIPKGGEGEFPLLGASRHFAWRRDALDAAAVRFDAGRVVVSVHVVAEVSLPLEALELPFDFTIAAEPVMSSDYAVKLQSVAVKVSSSDRRLEVANAVGGVFDALDQKVRQELERFSYDVRPLVSEAFVRVAQPARFALSGAGAGEACARVKVLDVEAGPTVLADGIEKDLALVIAPEVTLPCAVAPDEAPPRLPPLSNVAALPAGPFTISIPIAATYDELARAMGGLFSDDGRLAVSKEHPGLYLEHPQLYESEGLVVLSLHLHGPVHALGVDADLDGDIFLSGHVTVADNEIAVPDLEPTIETKNLLLSIKAATGVSDLRDQARRALRLDLADRLKQLRAALEGDLTFGGKDACFLADVDRLELGSVFGHGTYLRVYVTVTGRARAMMPCAR